MPRDRPIASAHVACLPGRAGRAPARPPPTNPRRRGIHPRSRCDRPGAVPSAGTSRAMPPPWRPPSRLQDRRVPALSRSHASGRGPEWGDTRPPAACARMGIAARSCLRPTCGVPGDAPMGVVWWVHRWVPIPYSVPRDRVGRPTLGRGPTRLGRAREPPADTRRPADLEASRATTPSLYRADAELFTRLRHGFESDTLVVAP